jgi:plasmid replication initiation protein
MGKNKVRMVSLDEAKNSKIVVKSNRLIEASYRLTTQEQRVILIMASMVKKDDEDFSGYQIKIADFAEMVGVKGQSTYDEIKRITKKLLTRVIIIHEPTGDLQIGWLSSAKYYKKKGTVELHFDPKLKPYLLKIQEFFTKYKLKEVIRLKSSYSIRLYELLKQYEGIGSRSFTIHEFRKILGIEEDKYKLYGHLKNKVIMPAQKELNEQCDLSFNFKEIKKGRKVVKIDFFILSTANKENECFSPAEDGKEESPKNEQELEPGLAEIRQRLTEQFCLSEKQADQIIKDFNAERITKNLEYVENKYKDGSVNNIGPYTLKAIEENYIIKKSQFEIEKERQKLVRKKEEERKLLAEKLKQDYEKYRSEKIDNYKETIPAEELTSIENTLRVKIEKEKKPRFGLDIFVRLAVENHLEELAGVVSFEEWKKNNPETKKMAV